MRLAISNIAWTKNNDELMYSRLKQIGVGAIEIAPTRIFSISPYDNLLRASDYAKILKEKFDLDIVSLQSIWYGREENIFRSKIDRDILVEYTFKVIDFAVAMNCCNIVFGNPKQRNGYSQKYKKIAKDFFWTISEYAKQKNVIISLEPNPKIYNTNFLNTTLETIDYIKEISHPNLRLNLDLGTLIENNESFEIITNNLDLINHIHISEPFLKPILKREVHRQLVKLDYKGIISIEMDNSSSLEEIVKIILYMKEVIK
jgi:sugar phosphate isomerase/epimerase